MLNLSCWKNFWILHRGRKVKYIHSDTHMTFKGTPCILKGFPDSSVGKQSACNAGDPSSIPGLGRSAGEGIGYPLQYSWTSLVAQMVKNLPAMQETWVWSLSWEDSLEKGKATHSYILAWRIPWTVYSMGLQRVGHDWVTLTSLHAFSTGMIAPQRSKNWFCWWKTYHFYG